jgi:ribokinase
MIVVFGSINIDLVTRVPHLPAPGETVPGEDYRLIPGGKGANQALAAARAGAQVAMVGAVGADVFAAPALAGLEAAGVDLSGVRRVPAPTGLAAITVDAAGENVIALSGGANRQVRAADLPGAALHPGVTLLLQMEIDDAATLAAARAAKAAGARVILSLAPFRLVDPAALAAVDWLMLNETEAAALMAHLDLPGCDDAARAPALARRLGTGVITTLGPRGAVAGLADGRAVRVPALAVTAIDTTAAGDTFAGVFAAGLDGGLDIETALRRAAVAGSLACTVMGAQTSMPDAAAIAAALSA